MKIAICDDESETRCEVQALIENFNMSCVQFEIFQFGSGEELTESYCNGNQFDIIFLDVKMNMLDGIETAAKIRSFQNDVIIIFVSGYPSYVFETFKVEALHFIVKPIDPDEFNDVFCRAINKYNLINSFICFKWQNDRLKTPINDIIYIEGYNRHLKVHTANKNFETVGKMSDLLKSLAPHGFLHIHQGFLVNMNYIKLFEKNDVILTNGEKAMVSIRKRSEALKAFDEYLRKRKW